MANGEQPPNYLKGAWITAAQLLLGNPEYSELMMHLPAMISDPIELLNNQQITLSPSARRVVEGAYLRLQKEQRDEQKRQQLLQQQQPQKQQYQLFPQQQQQSPPAIGDALDNCISHHSYCVILYCRLIYYRSGHVSTAADAEQARHHRISPRI